MSLQYTLTSLFGSLALLGIVVSGFLMMFSPRTGKELLKSVFIATGLFVVGSMLLQSFLSGYP